MTMETTFFFLRIDELHTTINPHRTATDSNCTFPVFIKCSVTQSAESNYSWKENMQNLKLWFSSNPSFPLYFWHTLSLLQTGIMNDSRSREEG